MNSNILSLSSQRSLTQIAKAFSRSLERLASGKRINSARDDAAGLAIASGLESQIRALRQVSRNINDAHGILNTADGAIETQTGIIQRMRELAIQSANGTYSAADRENLDGEFQELRDEFERLSTYTSFNGVNLLDGTFGTKSLQLGVNKGESIQISLPTLRATQIFDEEDLSGSEADGTSESPVTSLSFENQAPGSGGNPWGIVAADFNGDGNLDLASADGGATLSLSFGNGDGSFQSRVTLASVGGHFGISAGDINGDGITDLVAGVFASNNMITYLGNGDGTFQTGVTLASGAGPRQVTLADVNGDTNLDIVANDANDSTVSIYLGNGNGSFASRTTITVGSNPIDLSVTDLNGDGHADIVNSDGNSATISIALGNGNGTFQTRTTLAAASCRGVSAVDVNGDGYKDIVWASGNTISIALGNGNGTFQSQTTFASAASAYECLTTDVNGDGKVDIVTGMTSAAGGTRHKIYVHLGNGDGTFQTATSWNAAKEPYNIIAADWNSDGHPDLAFSMYTLAGVSLILGNGDGSFYRPNAANLNSNLQAIRLKDLNGDDHLDIVTSGGGTGHPDEVAVLLSNGDGTYQAPTTLAAGSRPYSLFVVDINSDSLEDIIVGDSNSTTLSIFLGNGNGTFQTRTTLSSGSTPYSVYSTDFNNDGKLDLISADRGSSTISLYLGNGNGTFQARTTLAVGSLPEWVHSADFNNDGNADILSVDVTSQTLSLYLGNGNGTFQTRTTLATGTSPDNAVTEDLDGDGNLDIISSDGSGVSIYFGNGNGTFQSPVTVPDSSNGFVSVSDMDGDDINDILLCVGNSVSIYRGNGDGTFQSPFLLQVGLSYSALDTGDLDGDGVRDLVVAEGSIRDVAWYINEMTSGDASGGDSEADSDVAAPISILTQSSSEDALDTLSDALETLASARSEIGALQSRLDSAANMTLITSEYLSQAKSQISDVDYADELAELSKLQILRDAGIGIAVQANINLKLVLELLKVS